MDATAAPTIVDRFLASLIVGADLAVHPPDPDALERYEAEIGVSFPPTHRELLRRTNGLEVFQGHIRLFGVGPTAAVDMRWWNAAGTWKFAFPPDRLQDYLFVGEDGWGHQYAYKVGELRALVDPPLSLLALDYPSPLVFASFQTFVQSPLFRGAGALGDALNREVHARLGPISSDQHFLHDTLRLWSFLNDEARRIIKTSSVEAMVLAGDISKAVAGQRLDRRMGRLRYDHDAAGRLRVNVVWRDECSGASAPTGTPSETAAYLSAARARERAIAAADLAGTRQSYAEVDASDAVDRFLASLVVGADPVAHAPDAESLEQYQAELGVRLPVTHLDLLAGTNGLEVFQGHIRLFGVGPTAGIDMRWWNKRSTWRFAYRAKALQDYIFVAENAWGHQYAYRVAELRDLADPPLYLVTQDLQPALAFQCFQAFINGPTFDGSLLDEPVNRDVHARLGAVGRDEHFLHSSFGLHDFDDQVRRTMKAGSVEAMILWGDLLGGLTRQPPEREISQLLYERDAKGRLRVEVIWPDESG